MSMILLRLGLIGCIDRSANGVINNRVLTPPSKILRSLGNLESLILMFPILCLLLRKTQTQRKYQRENDITALLDALSR